MGLAMVRMGCQVGHGWIMKRFKANFVIGRES
jgi:hypothetical protein